MLYFLCVCVGFVIGVLTLGLYCRSKVLKEKKSEVYNTIIEKGGTEDDSYND